MSSGAVSSPRRAAARTAAGRRAAPRAAGTRRGVAAPLPRRVSGPTTGRARAATAPRQSTVGARTLALVRSLPDHSLIDRLVRGRAWIPVLGVLLVGLVAMQVEILKLGNRLGRSIERSSVLQSQNDSLQAGLATLADDQRIERLATGMGMALPSPGLLSFIGAHPQTQLARALANIHAPDPSGFDAQLAAQAATAALIAPVTSSVASGTSQTGTTGAAGAASGSTTASTAPSGTSASGTAATGTSATGTTATGASATQTSVTGAGAAATANPTGAGTTATTSPATAGSPPGANGAAGLPSTTQSGGPSGG